MKFISFAATMLLLSSPDNLQFTETVSTIYRGDMRIDRFVDYTGNVVCYVAQHNNGSSHTTPAINCLKFK